MTFHEAKLARKPFGRYAGHTLDDIASTDEGLRHLDWLLGWFTQKPLLYPRFQKALKTFLGDPAIAADLERIVR